MKTYRVEVAHLVEQAVLEIDLPVVVGALLRETGAHSVNIYDEQEPAFYDPQN